VEPINLDATEATPVTIRTKAEDGSISEHHFEVLTLNHPRFVQFQALAKKLRAIQQKDDPTAKEQLEMAGLMAEALDLRVHSTNGPVSITSLWDAGLIGLEHLRLLGERLNEEAVGPPA
jgi:hypothetical protein